MAHFAEISPQNIVIRVLVVPDTEEHRGGEYLSGDLGLGGVWVQCSYNNRIRKQYPGVGYAYNPGADVFVAPQPYPSWSINGNFDWQPPVEKPQGAYVWDESLQQWVAFQN
jgi:hypothetical protein